MTVADEIQKLRAENDFLRAEMGRMANQGDRIIESLRAQLAEARKALVDQKNALQSQYAGMVTRADYADAIETASQWARTHIGALQRQVKERDETEAHLRRRAQEAEEKLAAIQHALGLLRGAAQGLVDALPVAFVERQSWSTAYYNLDRVLARLFPR